MGRRGMQKGEDEWKGGGGITLALGDKVRSLLTFASIYTQSPLY